MARLPYRPRPVDRAPRGAPWVVSVAAFDYSGVLPNVLRRYKFHDDLAAGRRLADLSLPTLSSAEQPQALVPVPLHRQRLRDRGFNQAHGLARDWGRALSLPVLGTALTRIRHTTAQTRLDAEARRTNVRHAFHARGSCPAHVALVDDVFTTGSTAWAAADALRAAGAQRVDVWVVARVPKPDAQSTDQDRALDLRRTSHRFTQAEEQ